MKPLSFTSNGAWREWLEKNHLLKKEVWLVFFKKNTGKQTFSYEDALDESLCFGWIDGKLKSLDNNRYMIRFTPRSQKSLWSAQNVARYKSLLVKGLVLEAGKKAFAAKTHVYTSTLGKKSYEWHLANRMPKNPTLEQRISWHLGHKEHCNCRPIPDKLKAEIEKRKRVRKND